MFINDIVGGLLNAGGGIAQWPSKAGVHHSYPPRAGYHAEPWVTTPEFLTRRSKRAQELVFLPSSQEMLTLWVLGLHFENH